MTRRQALISAAILVPFAQTTDNRFGVTMKPLPMPKFTLSYSLEEGTITIASKTRSVTVSMDEIMDALDPHKAER